MLPSKRRAREAEAHTHRTRQEIPKQTTEGTPYKETKTRDGRYKERASTNK